MKAQDDIPLQGALRRSPESQTLSLAFLLDLAELTKSVLESCLLMENEQVYMLEAGDDISPVFESPLDLFDPVTLDPALVRNYRIPSRLTGTVSPG
jgi:predicted Ser/Thr protein kinase